MRLPFFLLGYTGLGIVAGFAAAFAAQSHSVGQAALAFSTDALTVAAGDSVVFANEDRTAHNVLVSDWSTDSGIIRPGDSYALAVPADASGVFEVRCAIHPRMVLTLTVE